MLPTEVIEMVATHLTPWDYINYKTASNQISFDQVHFVSPRSYLTFYQDKRIQEAIERGYTLHVLPKYINDDVFLLLVDAFCVTELLWVLERHHLISDKVLQLAFDRIGSAGYFESLSDTVLIRLFQLGRISPGSLNYLPIRMFCRNGDIEWVCRCLQLDATNVQTIMDCFSSATARQHENVARILLDSAHFDFDLIKESTMAFLACQENTALALDMNGRFNQKSKRQLFDFAIRKGNIEIVNSLLHDQMITETMLTDGIQVASSRNQAKILEILLKKVKVLPTNNILEVACSVGCNDVVEVLLSDPRIDPSAENNQALVSAVLMNRYDIVKKLLDHERVDPSARYDLALSLAKANPRMLEILQTYQSVS